MQGHPLLTHITTNTQTVGKIQPWDSSRRCCERSESWETETTRQNKRLVKPHSSQRPSASISWSKVSCLPIVFNVRERHKRYYELTNNGTDYYVFIDTNLNVSVQKTNLTLFKKCYSYLTPFLYVCLPSNMKLTPQWEPGRCFTCSGNQDSIDAELD